MSITVLLFALFPHLPQPIVEVSHATYESVQAEYCQHNFCIGGRSKVGGFTRLSGYVCEVHYSQEAPDAQRCRDHERRHCPEYLGGPVIQWHGNDVVRDC